MVNFYAAFLWSYAPIDLPPGQKVKLAELKALAANDEEMQNLTKQQEQEFIDKLVEFREHKTTSARANNAAAARDMLCTSDSINTQVSYWRARNPYFPLSILLYHSSTTSPFARGPTDAYSWFAAMSMTLQLPPGTAATTPWTSGKML
jgi:hypothetical protein